MRRRRALTSNVDCAASTARMRSAHMWGHKENEASGLRERETGRESQQSAGLQLLPISLCGSSALPASPNLSRCAVAVTTPPTEAETETPVHLVAGVWIFSTIATPQTCATCRALNLVFCSLPLLLLLRVARGIFVAVRVSRYRVCMCVC